MNPTGNVADEDITLDSLAPPTYQGRTVLWSGEDNDPAKPGRVPELGETVRWEKGTFGVVLGYFQTNGLLGVKLSLDITGEVVCLFGSEIDVASEYVPPFTLAGRQV